MKTVFLDREKMADVRARKKCECSFWDEPFINEVFCVGHTLKTDTEGREETEPYYQDFEVCRCCGGLVDLHEDETSRLTRQGQKKPVQVVQIIGKPTAGQLAAALVDRATYHEQLMQDLTAAFNSKDAKP